MKAGKKAGTTGAKRAIGVRKATGNPMGRLAAANRGTASNGRKSAGENAIPRRAAKSVKSTVGTTGTRRAMPAGARVKATRRQGPVRRSTH